MAINLICLHTHLAHYILRQNFAIDPNKFVRFQIPASFDQMLDYLLGWLKNSHRSISRLVDAVAVCRDVTKALHSLTCK